ncbi:NAD(P)/FAD-dependent oxidoreductase [Mycobacterium sp. 141]|uniref:NAD(P)/FAD-dependent oxidoreductase n=1 Tax=Mycobacterium sp. 141 TaxID=1120797 RepID=UPI00055A8CCC|nr:NAD(P)/FAD-dependent oxidoreductase [Mycobacterium sp. 141]
MAAEEPDVLILGGGLAGVACARHLGQQGLAVTLVDRNDYNQFQPLLYQVATSQLPAEDIARPLRAITADLPNVDVVVADVESANLSDRTLTLRDGRTMSGDHLVIAAGARPNFFGVPGAAEHSFPLYSVADAERLRLHTQALFNRPDEDGALDIVVVGGGPTGVETAGALAELGRALRVTGQLPDRGSVHIVDHGPALLAPFSDKAHEYARKKLTAENVVVHSGTGVTRVREDGVDLNDGTAIVARTVIWAGGESAASIASDAGSATGRGGRIDVRPDLTVEGFTGVYAVGDVANVPDGDGTTGAALPQLGSVAQQSGTWAARNIVLDRQGKQRKPFRYVDKGIMAMIGRNAAIAEVGKHRHQVEGPAAFAAWLGVHAMLVSGVHSKIDTFLTWAWDYFERDHSAMLEFYSAPRRIVWAHDESERPHISLDRAQQTD